MILPVVLAGGDGTRLWPLSRSNYPKQLLNLLDGRTMLQGTLQRLTEIDELLPPIISCNTAYRFAVMEQALQILQPEAVLLEPTAYGTAPAVILAALYAEKTHLDPLLLVLPSDHHLPDVAHFARMLQQAVPAANEGKLVTFGVTPTRPHTGYGYILADTVRTDGGYPVKFFVEKPVLEIAEAYVKSGEYYWNSGIFMFRAVSILAEAKRYTPELLTVCQRAIAALEADADFLRIRQQDLLGCPTISLDHAIMERTKKAVVFPCEAPWADLGVWGTLWDLSAKDEHNNVVKGDVIGVSNSNCYIQSSSRLVVAIGLQDQIVVETPDAILIVNQQHEQEVKQVVEQLTAAARPEAHKNEGVNKSESMNDRIKA